MFREHTALVRRKAGFNSRTDLLMNDEWACMPLEATDPCKVGEVGSTPIRSTERHGLLVQWDDAGSASRKSRFNSAAVH